jgi:hypothetical protein
MHARAAAERMDALDQLIYRSRSRKAAEAAKAHVSRVQVRFLRGLSQLASILYQAPIGVAHSMKLHCLAPNIFTRVF